MGDYLDSWIKFITPIAEEEGIRLGIHPCDPPVEKLGGIPFAILHTFTGIEDIFLLIDALIISGGNFDIHPSLYGNKNQ